MGRNRKQSANVVVGNRKLLKFAINMVSNKSVVNDLVSLLTSYGVKQVIISPGSRNASLIISLTNDNDITTYSVVDERSAGFIALGMAQQSGQPVALVCTSGTASLNYSPAVAEAFYQKIPLIVITADRPEERIDQGEGQSINQGNIYGSHVKVSIQLTEEQNSREKRRFNNRKISFAINNCIEENSGPIHINLPQSEDLYITQDFPDLFPNPIFHPKLDKLISKSELSWIDKKISSSKKTLILVGVNKPSQKLNKTLSSWVEKSKALVLTETTSNLVDKNYIPCIDRLIMTFSEEESKDFIPDLLITFGTNIISKKIKFLLRSKQIEEHWHIDEGGEMMDTYQSLTKIYSVSPLVFFQQTLPNKNLSTKYASKWLKKNEFLKKSLKNYNNSVIFSDYSVVEKTLKKIPSKAIIQMGNSSIVRYIQLFDPKITTEYYANRGTSGIDGSTSTALGFSINSDKTVYFFTGDISFFYDNNALWNNYTTANLKIILINNGGGGIFKIIDGPSKTNSQPYFTTEHNLRASQLCDMHDVAYYSADSFESLEKKTEELISSTKCSLLEINTKNIQNDKVLKDFFKHINL